MVRTAVAVGVGPSSSRRGTGRVGSSSLRGHSFLELMVVLVLLTVLVAGALPRVGATIHEYRLRGAAFHLRGLLRQARARAVAESRYVGVVFEEVDGDPVFSMYGDGNSNGIRRRDIRVGVEERLREPYRLSETFPGVRYGSLPMGADTPFFPGPSHRTQQDRFVLTDRVVDDGDAVPEQSVRHRLCRGRIRCDRPGAHRPIPRR